MHFLLTAALLLAVIAVLIDARRGTGYNEGEKGTGREVLPNEQHEDRVNGKGEGYGDCLMQQKKQLVKALENVLNLSGEKFVAELHSMKQKIGRCKKPDDDTTENSATYIAIIVAITDSTDTTTEYAATTTESAATTTENPATTTESLATTSESTDTTTEIPAATTDTAVITTKFSPFL